MKPAVDLTRTRELAQIHIAKAQLGMDDDTYRSMLWAVGRVESAANLDWAGRKKVLDHLKACGFKPKAKTTKHVQERPRNFGSEERGQQLKKVEALLADAGRPWSYAESMARRMFKVDALEFCNPDHLQRLIAALSYDQTRRAKRASSKESQ